MNALAWGFAAMGAAAAVPVIFHLIRQPTRERTEFGSLMFLTPSPPRLDRRSRIGDWLLLLLRCLAVLAIVAAFVRPYFSSRVQGDALPGRTIVLLDTSASMSRGDLRSQATAAVAELPDGPTALWAFDQSVRTLVPFDAPRSAILEAVEAIARDGGTAAATNLDAAITQAAEQLRDDDGGTVVVLSDLQQGAAVDGLQAFDWPAGVRVDLRPLRVDDDNATLSILPDSADAAGTVRLRVRNHNASDAMSLTGSGSVSQVSVRPGESQVIPIDDPSEPTRVTLRGDASPFDNTVFIAVPTPRTVRLRNLSSTGADDPDGPMYYLSQAVEAGDVATQFVDKPSETADLTLIDRTIDANELDATERSLRAGGTVVVLPRSVEDAAALGELIGPTEPFAGPIPDDRLIARLDFTSELLTPFRGAGYNDFSDVRFWTATPFRPATESDAAIVATFDDGLPAIWTLDRSPGRVVVFSSGWSPERSQLALAAKFVPLVDALLPPATAVGRVQLEVGERVRVAADGRTATVQLPTGDPVPVTDGWFDRTDRPGIYTVIADDAEPWSLAVNVAAREGRTQPFDRQQLIDLGVPVEADVSASESRILRERELERQQKLWKWCVAAALVLLGLEMTLAGWRLSRPRSEATA